MSRLGNETEIVSKGRSNRLCASVLPACFCKEKGCDSSVVGTYRSKEVPLGSSETYCRIDALCGQARSYELVTGQSTRTMSVLQEVEEKVQGRLKTS
jgi:hypothetical protein